MNFFNKNYCIKKTIYLYYIMNFIFYDLETTGLINARIVEIAAYSKLNDTYYHSLVNPECIIPDEVIKIHNITNEAVKDAKIVSEILVEFENFCGEDAILVAHNNDNFDKLVLQSEYNRANKEIPVWKHVDTLKISRTLLPDLGSHKLTLLKEYYNINLGVDHSALGDVKNMYAIYCKMVGNRTDQEIFDISTNFVLQKMPFGKHKGKLIKNLPKDYKKWLLMNACSFGRNEDLRVSLK